MKVSGLVGGSILALSLYSGVYLSAVYTGKIEVQLGCRSQIIFGKQ